MDADQFNTILRVQETLRQEIRENHERTSRRIEDTTLRLEGKINAATHELSGKLDTHQREDDEVEKRLAVIENERKREKQDVVKRGAMIVLGITLAFDGIKMFVEWLTRAR